MKNVACLVPRLQRKFAKDPKKMMSSGYYGREMTLEEQEAKLQARLDAQSRNDQDPLLALLHDKEFDYDYESDSMGKANIISTVWKLCVFSIIQILCEIKFVDLRNAKSTILAHFDTLDSKFS